MIQREANVNSLRVMSSKEKNTIVPKPILFEFWTKSPKHFKARFETNCVYELSISVRNTDTFNHN